MIGWERVAAFGDEAAEDLDAQIACLQRHEIGWIEFRGAWGENVLRLGPDRLRRARQALDAAGVRVAAVGSPVGKVDIQEDWSVSEAMLGKAFEAADILGTRLIRVFSFFVPANGADASREAVLEKLGQMAGLAERAGLQLVHENEKGIYGDSPERCADLLETIGSPALRACFDVANFVQVGTPSIEAAWSLLARHVVHVHVKDAIRDGTVVPAGEGDGEWPWLLEQLETAGYSGILSIEPHLEGLDGCARLGRAASALRDLLRAGAQAGTWTQSRPASA